MIWPYDLVLLAAAMVVGFSKGGLSSSGSLAVPLAALFMNPIEAAALLLPVFLATDWVAVWLYRRDYSGRNLAIMVPGMMAGVALATVATPWTPESLLLLITALIGFWYVARSWFGAMPSTPSRARVGPGFFWGALAGLTSFVTHSGAPPAQAYLLPQRLPKLAFAGTMAIAFATVNLSKVPGYWALGQFSGLDWTRTAMLIGAGVAGTVIGRWLTGVLSDRVYLRVIEGLLLTLSVLLLGRAASLAFHG